MEKHKKVAWWLLGGSGVAIGLCYIAAIAATSVCRLSSRSHQITKFRNTCDTDILVWVMWLFVAVAIGMFPLLFTSRGVFKAWSWFAAFAVPLLALYIYSVLNYGRSSPGSFIDYTYDSITILLILFVLISYIVMFVAWLWGRKKSK